MRHALGLDFMTAADLSPATLVAAAAANGCQSASVLVQPLPGLPDHGFLGDLSVRREARQASDHHSVVIDMAEGFMLAPDTDLAAYRQGLACAAYLGVTFTNALVRDPDEARMLDNLGRWSELNAEYGLRPLIEFMAVSSLPSLASAVDAIARSGATGMTLTVDALHLVRTGGSPAELRALDPGLIGRAQINDGPLVSPLPPRDEAIQQRQIPGQGAFPLTDFVAALPQGITIGVEVPLRDLTLQGVTGEERVRRAVQGARDVLAAV